MNKEWKPITGFEELYKISDSGDVLRIDSQRILSKRVSKKGYVKVALSKDGKQYHFDAHRLVAMHFVPNENGYTEVNHKDGNKENNHHSNLEWCTRSQNVKHSFDSGLREATYKNKFGALHNKSKTVEMYNKNMVSLGVFGSAREAGRVLGIWQGGISRVCRGEQETAVGYVFRYI